MNTLTTSGKLNTYNIRNLLLNNLYIRNHFPCNLFHLQVNRELFEQYNKCQVEQVPNYEISLISFWLIFKNFILNVSYKTNIK